MSRSWAAKKGFTLVELLVSISIIGVITGAMMANFRGGQQSTEVRLASELLVSQLRGLQTSALSGRLVKVCSGGANDLKVCEPKDTPVSCTGGVCQSRVPVGYGMRLTSSPDTSFVLFDDTDGDKRYDVGEEIVSESYVSTGVVRLTAISSGFPTDLVYTPPFGELFVNGSATGTATVALTLGHRFGNMIRHVNVYRLSGKIEHD